MQPKRYPFHHNTKKEKEAKREVRCKYRTNSCINLMNSVQCCFYLPSFRHFRGVRGCYSVRCIVFYLDVRRRRSNRYVVTCTVLRSWCVGVRDAVVLAASYTTTIDGIHNNGKQRISRTRTIIVCSTRQSTAVGKGQGYKNFPNFINTASRGRARRGNPCISGSNTF